jgi:hypothetical protein
VNCEDGYYCCDKADEDCDCDYCPDCYIEAKGPPTCTDGHPLEDVYDTDRNPGCDVCGEHIDVNNVYFRCTNRCNYDVCETCVNERRDQLIIFEEIGEHEDTVDATKGGEKFGELKMEVIDDEKTL